MDYLKNNTMREIFGDAILLTLLLSVVFGTFFLLTWFTGATVQMVLITGFGWFWLFTVAVLGLFWWCVLVYARRELIAVYKKL